MLLGSAPFLDKKYTVFGRVVKGDHVLSKLELVVSLLLLWYTFLKDGALVVTDVERRGGAREAGLRRGDVIRNSRRVFFWPRVQ